jgi:hypothetical protein
VAKNTVDTLVGVRLVLGRRVKVMMGVLELLITPVVAVVRDRLVVLVLLADLVTVDLA